MIRARIARDMFKSSRWSLAVHRWSRPHRVREGLWTWGWGLF